MSKGCNSGFQKHTVWIGHRRFFATTLEGRDPALREFRIKYLKDERVHVPSQQRTVVERRCRRTYLSRYQIIGVRKEITVVRSLTCVCKRERHFAAPTCPTDALHVVGRCRGQVAEHDRIEVIKAHADLEGRRAGDHVDDRLLVIVESCFERESRVRVHLCGVLADDQAAWRGFVLATVEAALGRRLERL